MHDSGGIGAKSADLVTHGIAHSPEFIPYFFTRFTRAIPRKCTSTLRFVRVKHRQSLLYRLPLACRQCTLGQFDRVLI